MNDIRTLLQALGGVLGHSTIAPIIWSYEHARAQGSILLPPPSTWSVSGNYLLGKTIWKHQPKGAFGLNENELPQHLAIYGRTGAGKTNCAFLLIKEIIRNNKPFLIFDWKQTYRTLSKKNEIHFYTPGHKTAPFSFNPLHLGHVPPSYRDAYLRHLLSVLINVYFRDLRLLSVEGVEYLLLRAFDSLKHEKGTFCFGHLYTWLVNYKATSRERDWKSSALNVLYKLTTGPLGEVLNNPPNIAIENIIQQKTIIELHWLGSPKDKTFLMQTILLQLYYQFSQLPPTKKLRYFILIEEAHNILLRHTSGYETIIEMILRQAREYGVSLCLLDQHPSLMSLPALGTYCTIAFNLRAKEDIDVMGAALNLGEDRDYLSRLPTGQAIVKLQDRFLNPFLVAFPKATMSNEHIPLEDPHGYFSSSEDISEHTDAEEDISETDRNLEKEAKQLLIDFFHHPLLQTTERYRRLGWNPRKGNALKNNLLKRALIQPIDITTKTGRIRLFDLTPMGKQLLREQGIYPEHAGRQGSLPHQFWCTQIKVQLEEMGYEVTIEFSLGEKKAIDLVAEKEGRRIALEIETGKSNTKANIDKCLQAGFTRIILIAVTAQVKNYLEALIKGMSSEETIEVQTAAMFSIE